MDGWRAVRVESVDVRVVDPDDEAIERRLVRARVHLGRLCPADVHVHAVSARTPADAPTPAPLGRLWSVQSYGNGTYVFEAHLSPAATTRGLRVQVSRREDARDGEEPAPPIARSRPVSARARRPAD